MFVAFRWYEAAANQLPNPTLDPVARISEFKHSAVRLRAGAASCLRDDQLGGKLSSTVA